MVNTEAFSKIKYNKDDETGIVWVFINTPELKNAMSLLSFYEMHLATDAFVADKTAGAMIITGASAPDNDDPTRQAFSSGGYFDPNEKCNLVSPGEDSEDSPLDPTDIAQKKLTLRMWLCEKPIVAAINGLAIGAGFTLPLACADLILASEHAWAHLPFVKLGILPEFASTFLLPRLLGYQRAKEIMFLAERIPAQKLLDLGLINKVVPHDQLLSAAREVAQQLIPPAGAGMAVKLTKKALHKPLIDDLAAHLDLENEGLNIAFTTQDFVEGMVARREKRAPRYKGA
jgi:2-(1,2-epoxy-1,2-dihydrophenyl)acetyl-CoA isomerase